MSDANLLAFGCAVSFIALAGIYVFLREHVVGGPREEAKVPDADEVAEAPGIS